MYDFWIGFVELIGGMGETFFNGGEYLAIFGVLTIGVIVALIIKNVIF